MRDVEVGQIWKMRSHEEFKIRVTKIGKHDRGFLKGLYCVDFEIVNKPHAITRDPSLQNLSDSYVYGAFLDYFKFDHVETVKTNFDRDLEELLK